MIIPGTPVYAVNATATNIFIVITQHIYGVITPKTCNNLTAVGQSFCVIAFRQHRNTGTRKICSCICAKYVAHCVACKQDVAVDQRIQVSHAFTSQVRSGSAEGIAHHLVQVKSLSACIHHHQRARVIFCGLVAVGLKNSLQLCPGRVQNDLPKGVVLAYKNGNIDMPAEHRCKGLRLPTDSDHGLRKAGLHGCGKVSFSLSLHAGGCCGTHQIAVDTSSCVGILNGDRRSAADRHSTCYAVND